MYLFEIKTDRKGEFSNCYIWANDHVEAREMFADKYKGVNIESIKSILRSYDKPFVVEISDGGFYCYERSI